MCDAGSRLFVHESIYEEFIKHLVENNKNIQIGNAFDGPHINFGPLINKRSVFNSRQFESVLNYIRIGKEEEQLECVLGGERHGSKGYFVKPTVFKNVPDSSKLA